MLHASCFVSADGVPGSGKSTLLTAICCAFGCSAALLGVQSLAELRSTDTDEVRCLLSSFGAFHARLAA
jgi:ABC-type lipoprotein export system ATPase subunit